MKKNSKATLRLIQPETDCNHCAVWSLCFGDSDNQHCVKVAHGILKERGPLPPGWVFYHPGDEFRHIYIVQSGVVKTETETEDGRLNVTGIYTNGDIFGLEGIGSKRLPGRAVASRETFVCELSYAGLLQKCAQSPTLLRELMAKMGQRIQADEYKWKTIQKEPASSRVLCFLQDIQKKQGMQNGQQTAVNLPASKQDIANFLGLTPESLSRALKKLKNEGSIQQINTNTFSIIADCSTPST